jgi:hypothetical protein
LREETVVKKLMDSAKVMRIVLTNDSNVSTFINECVVLDPSIILSSHKYWTVLLLVSKKFSMSSKLNPGMSGKLDMRSSDSMFMFSPMSMLLMLRESRARSSTIIDPWCALLLLFRRDRFPTIEVEQRVVVDVDGIREEEGTLLETLVERVVVSESEFKRPSGVLGREKDPRPESALSCRE